MTHSNESFFENTGRLFFKREQVRELEGRLLAAGVNMQATAFAGYLALNIMAGTIFLTMILLIYAPSSNLLINIGKIIPWLPGPILWVLALVVAFVFVYLAVTMLVSSYLMMKMEDRRKKLEDVLPDFLVLVGSNIKAGMTLDQAMWYSAKPEFGLLSTEVKTTIKGAFSGESLESSLDTLASRFDSRIFSRTVALLKQATATGGELTSVLEKTADDVRDNLMMKKEIAATLVLYEIFVLVAAIFGTPFLFAVAGKIVEIFEKIAPAAGGSVSGVSGAGGALGALTSVKISGPIITSSDFFMFSIPTIIVTAFASSLIVSVIRTGSRSEGMKYFPLILAGAFFVYWVVNTFIESFFTSLA